jgi:hypothetical protein
MRPPGPVVFVIMPFAEQFVSGFRDVIQPAVKKAGFECIRADQEPLGHIHRTMFERIFDSPVVIADISGGNPNVFYELGVSNCVARKTVTVAREDFIDHVPFDIAPYRVLVYPAPPRESAGDNARADYSARVEVAVENLSAELTKLAQDDSNGIPNPVQDFLQSRSPLTCTETRYLERFSGRWEEELLAHTKRELVHVALTGSYFAGMLAGYVESRVRETPLSVKFLLLDPEESEGWSFIYRLREGRQVTEGEVEKSITQDRMLQQRTEEVIQRLEGPPQFTGQVEYYSGIPLFWAYWVDRCRIIVGHLAMGRLTCRNLPVSVIVKDDPRTSVLFEYYASAIDSLTGP